MMLSPSHHQLLSMALSSLTPLWTNSSTAFQFRWYYSLEMRPRALKHAETLLARLHPVALRARHIYAELMLASTYAVAVWIRLIYDETFLASLHLVALWAWQIYAELTSASTCGAAFSTRQIYAEILLASLRLVAVWPWQRSICSVQTKKEQSGLPHIQPSHVGIAAQLWRRRM